MSEPDSEPASPYEGPRPLLHLAAIATLGLAFPLLSLLAAGPQFLVAHLCGPLEVVALAFALCFLLPAAFAGVVWLVGRVGERTRRGSLLGAIGLLGGLSALPVLRHASFLHWGLQLLLAAVTAGALAFAYARSARVRSLCTVFALGLVLVPAQFLLISPASQVLFGGEEQPAQAVTQAARPVPVVIVIFDEMSLVSLLDEELNIDAVRFPHLGRLAGGATWFRNATTPSLRTDDALPGMLSGIAPVTRVKTILPIAEKHPNTIYSLLAPSHDVFAFESVTALCPQAVRNHAPSERQFDLRAFASDLGWIALSLMVPPGLASGLPDITRQTRDFALHDSERFAAHARAGRDAHFQNLLNSIESGDRPRLFVIHSGLPHDRYEFFPNGQRYDPHGWIGNAHAEPETELRYLLQVGFVDTLVGRLVARLREAGLYDDCLLIVTADHGVGFDPAGHRRFPEPDDPGFADVFWVPMLVKAPNQREGLVSDRNVEGIDVLPTVADVLGFEIPWKHQGESMLDAQAPERATKRLGTTMQPAGDHTRALQAAMKRRLNRFGAGTPMAALYALTTHPELLGRPVSELQVSESQRLVRVQPGPEVMGDVDPQARSMPCKIRVDFMRSSGEGGDAEFPAGTAIALAVNGTLQALATTRDPSPETVILLVPPDALQAGANDLQVYVVEEGEGGVVLEKARKLP